MGYPKEVYRYAHETLSQRAAQAEKLQQAHRAEIRRKIPDIPAIEDALAQTANAVLRAVIANPEQSANQIDQLKQKNLELQQQRAALLTQYGYPPNYLDEQYTCAACRDTGYIGTTMCTCMQTLLKNTAFARLSEMATAEVYRFEHFHLHYYPEQAPSGQPIPREHMTKIYGYCQSYAAEFSPSSDNLLMLGQTGLGKTHLSLAIAYAVTERGFGVVYNSTQKLMDRLEAGKFSRQEDGRERYMDELSHLLSCDLLILDDLGTEFFTQFTTSTLYNLINTRMTEGRPTIINTNLEISQIEEKYSQRMVSRLVCGYKVLKFYGKDIRFLKKNA